ncbi:hypothetical protein [Nocardioides taihuensis]|uniref:DUF3800 domain-containing protein n=1 Tax=Nocardioides taihuensis TaxID=1835606 RepID=A0ABW0BET7_9ACTN
MATGPRLPLQGGLAPVAPATGEVVEVACDESGFSGTNLLDPATPVFTHASTDLDVTEAAALVAELRSGSRWSLGELKSAQFFRSPHAGEASAWLLAVLAGRAHVHIVDKEYFLVTRVLDLFLVDPSYAAGTRLSRAEPAAALAVYRDGRLRGTAWTGFLAAFVDLVRTKRHRDGDRDRVARFLAARDALLRAGLTAGATGVLARLDPQRVRAVVARLSRDDRSIPPPLEPLLPALAETVLHWSAGERQVLVVHDEQSALTPGRLLRLQAVLAAGGGPSPLAGLVTVDSRDDPRVQVADLLAGVVRRWPDLDDAALGPYLSATSLRDGAPRP